MIGLSKGKGLARVLGAGVVTGFFFLITSSFGEICGRLCYGWRNWSINDPLGPSSFPSLSVLAFLALWCCKIFHKES